MKEAVTETSATYETSDFYRMVWLCANDMVVSAVKMDGARATLVFEDGAGCRRVNDRMLMGNDAVSGGAMIEAFKRVKSLVRGGSRRES